MTRDTYIATIVAVGGERITSPSFEYKEVAHAWVSAYFRHNEEINTSHVEILYRTFREDGLADTDFIEYHYEW